MNITFKSFSGHIDFKCGCRFEIVFSENNIEDLPIDEYFKYTPCDKCKQRFEENAREVSDRFRAISINDKENNISKSFYDIFDIDKVIESEEDEIFIDSDFSEYFYNSTKV